MMRRPRRRPSTSKRPPPEALQAIEAKIESLGALGDGVAIWKDTPCFIAGTIPGDVVLAQIEGKKGDGFCAKMTRLVQPSPNRAEPPCPYFGACGGCSLQHLSPSFYRKWKTNLLEEALKRAGFAETRIDALCETPPGSRRRASFAWRRKAGKITLGFNGRASHSIVAVKHCLLLEPALNALLAPLAKALAALGQDGDGDAEANLSDSGIDLVLSGTIHLDLFAREILADFARTADLARLSFRSKNMIEPIVTLREPVMVFAGQTVRLPYGSFLQPSSLGERILTGHAFDAAKDARRIADLFSGCGTFSFVLAQKAEISAFESDKAAIDALNEAALRTSFKISGYQRDLFRNPLAGSELEAYDAVLFDPPRAGAAEQCKALAASGPKRIIAVSCNPQSFARDARILAGGGYEMAWAVPVDQFFWSSHLEIVALFLKKE